jgi:hypothetical protein
VTPTTRAAAIAASLLVLAAPADAQLIVLSATGQVHDGLPVLRPHPDPAATEAALTRGFSGRLLRLYALEQEFLRRKTGRAPEPAYLLLSDRQGGFPQFGFYLGDQPKAGVGWVDLHRGSRLTGQFGAMDQIFPHELLHVIVRQLAGEPRESGGNQIHAVGVRSDPVNAFNEGLAEHVQIVAVDDPDAAPETRALATAAGIRAAADRAVEAYARDLAGGWWPIQPSRMRFLLWYNQTEQAERYSAVKANLFARARPIPGALLARPDKYEAYLFQSVMPGLPEGPARPAGVMLSTDGAVAHLFWRLATDPGLQQRYRDDAFYADFGVARTQVSPQDNLYLKLFAVLHGDRPSTTVETIHAWARLFPEDEADLARVVREALLGRALPDAPEIWLADDGLMTGTSLFDQYRGLPRVHTFDVNAATELDWLTVPGITRDHAVRVLAGGPYPDLDTLLASPEFGPAQRDRIRAMSAAMTHLRARAAAEEESLSLRAMIVPYLWRLGALMLAATAAGAWLALRAGVRRWWTAVLVALAASLLVVALAWVVVSPAWSPAAAPILLGGLPWALWRLARRRGGRPALGALVVWALAALPALVLTWQP